MRTVTDYNFKGQTALVRVDFNVKLDANHRIIDDARIKACLPTINKILNDGGRVVLMSHMGRPKGEYKERYSFKYIKAPLAQLLQKEVRFCQDCVGKEASQVVSEELNSGEVLLLENLRFHPEEKQGDRKFARQLAELGDVYVNDAFGTAHRAHASTYTVADFFPHKKRMMGTLMASELKHASHLVNSPWKPYTAIIGGSKVSDKIQLFRSLMQKADNILVGGGMAYTFLKAKGYQVGGSMVEEDKLDLAYSLMEEADNNHVRLYLPQDSMVTTAIKDEAPKWEQDNQEIPDEAMGADIGSKTIEQYKRIIRHSKTLFWNGPMGVFEINGLDNGTYRLAMAVAEATQKGAYSLIGGGDTATAFDQFNFMNQVSFVSTGGGALLTYIAGESLPALEALKEPETASGKKMAV